MRLRSDRGQFGGKKRHGHIREPTEVLLIKAGTASHDMGQN